MEVERTAGSKILPPRTREDHPPEHPANDACSCLLSRHQQETPQEVEGRQRIVLQYGRRDQMPVLSQMSTATENQDQQRTLEDNHKLYSTKKELIMVIMYAIKGVVSINGNLAMITVANRFR